jgi:hypothetical protein
MVLHYRGLGTNLESLYDNIKAELESEKNLQLVSEYKGEMNDIALRSIVAVNKSLKVFAGPRLNCKRLASMSFWTLP